MKRSLFFLLHTLQYFPLPLDRLLHSSPANYLGILASFARTTSRNGITVLEIISVPFPPSLVSDTLRVTLCVYLYRFERPEISPLITIFYNICNINYRTMLIKVEFWHASLVESNNCFKTLTTFRAFLIIQDRNIAKMVREAIKRGL